MYVGKYANLPKKTGFWEVGIAYSHSIVAGGLLETS